MTWSVRKAVPQDAAAACEVVRRSIVELCIADHEGDQVQIDEWLANKTLPNFRSWISSASHAAFVADGVGVICGFVLLNLSGTVAMLYVRPGHRFTGVSADLLAAIEAYATKSGIRQLKLRSTQTALCFYRAPGYSIDPEPNAGVGQPLQKMLL